MPFYGRPLGKTWLAHDVNGRKEHIFSNVSACSEEIDEKVMVFASARCSAILATLTESISKLSGPSIGAKNG